MSICDKIIPYFMKIVYFYDDSFFTKKMTNIQYNRNLL